jgi:hypothetical protein
MSNKIKKTGIRIEEKNSLILECTATENLKDEIKYCNKG